MDNEINEEELNESGYTNFGGTQGRAGAYYTPTGPIGRFFAKNLDPWQKVSTSVSLILMNKAYSFLLTTSPSTTELIGYFFSYIPFQQRLFLIVLAYL